MKDQLIKHNQTNTLIKWVLISERPITEVQAKEWQAKAGYPVAGYGFLRFVEGQSEGAYKAVWYSYEVCE